MRTDLQSLIDRIASVEAKMTFNVCHIERDEYAREAYDLALQLEADFANAKPGDLDQHVDAAVREVLQRYGLHND